MLRFTINSKIIRRSNKTFKKRREFGRAILIEKKLFITRNFLNFKKSVWMSAEDAVIKLPKKFNLIASTKDSKFTIIENT